MLDQLLYWLSGDSCSLPARPPLSLHWNQLLLWSLRARRESRWVAPFLLNFPCLPCRAPGQQSLLLLVVRHPTSSALSPTDGFSNIAAGVKDLDSRDNCVSV